MKNAMLVILTAIVVLVAATFSTKAASFKTLKKKGYNIGKLTKNKAGQHGWILSKDGEKHFCKMKASGGIAGSKIIGFSTSGRQIPLDRKAYEEYSGVSAEKRYPYMKDLKNGTMDKKWVGSCRKQR